jgi:tetratricopeptide (TPR) repeat protein
MADPAWQNRALVKVLVGLTAFCVVIGVLAVAVGVPSMGVWSLGVAAIAWLVFGGLQVLRKTVIDGVGTVAQQVLMPSGSSTPPAKGLSHIEALVARGELAKAAEAYRAEILADPADLGSCERLGTLAQRQLKDYELAVWAYRQAEQRAATPGRKFGFGLLLAGIYRDNLKDRGKTVVELRRLVHQYPDAPRLDALRAEIDELKAGLFDDRSA